MSTFSSEFSVSLSDSEAFSQLSGDYNPLHTSPAIARRTRFGTTVAHGIHLFLRALDQLAGRRLFDLEAPTALSATFDNAVLTGNAVHVRASVDGNRVRVSAQSAGRPVFNGTIALNPALSVEPAIEDAEFAAEYPDDVDFPPAVREGTVLLKLNRKILAALFPSLAKVAGTGWIADLLATTQIVGMRCPGMHSIYSGFKLGRATQPSGSPLSMHYRVDGIQERFHLVRVQVTGACLAGTLEAFFRPRPVAQRPMKSVAAVVPPGVFVGHSALIVGGSRGLGELTAKILAAGGANVAVTYARGKEDAERLCAEMRALGYSCTAHHMDVVTANSKAAPDWIASSRFSHVYFFASPCISMNFGPWDEALFHQYAQIYVTAFADLVEHTLGTRTTQNPDVQFVYPSSIFVTQPEMGFAEYAVAKAAGEALCNQLQGRYGARFAQPRLPRLRTDQTSSVVGASVVDPFPVMLDVIRNLHS